MTITSYTTHWHNRDNVTIVALQGITIIGTVRLDFHGEGKKECYLWNLHVSEDFRRRGIAKSLMQFAIMIARDRQVPTVELEWDKRDTPCEILDWYVRLGFTEKEIGSGNMLMVKELKGGNP